MLEFHRDIATPLSQGRCIPLRVRALWCHRITAAVPPQRCAALALVLRQWHQEPCEPWVGQHHAAMWHALEAYNARWQAVHRELRRLWYHHKSEIPPRWPELSHAHQEELLVGQLLRLPQLGGSGRCSSPLPAALWCHVASWAVGTVAEAFAWRHAGCGEWGQGLALLLKQRWPRLPPLHRVLPWLQAWTFAAQLGQGWGSPVLLHTTPLDATGKRRRIRVHWQNGMRSGESDKSLAAMDVPWTVRQCTVTLEIAPPSGPRLA